MSSRFSAAKPKRAGESYARAHHGEADDDDGPSKKVKFDVRNPSALAPDAREDDDVLDADVIGAGARGATKRGAVNIDGYDSDSDNEAFDARAEARGGKGKRKNGDEHVNLADQLDNYDERLKGDGAGGAEDDEDDDMFAADADDDAEDGGVPDEKASSKKSRKAVRFLDQKDIEGQINSSKSGGRVTLDDEESSDEEEAELAIQEEGVDEEVGAGGLKKHAPRIDAFNMREENEEGAFDEAGNFVRKAVDPDAVHDKWMEGFGKKDIKKAAAAHEKREEDMRRQRKEDDNLITSDLLARLITRLEKGETALEALARIGKGLSKSKTKKIPKWKQKKQKQATDGMDLDAEDTGKDAEKAARDAEIKDAIDAITEAADRLLKRDYAEIYDTEREMLMREYQKETGERWVEPQKPAEDVPQASTSKMWEYRWVDGRDNAAQQGPYDGPTMKAWQDAGYFSEGVEFRAVGDSGAWNQVVTFV